jgi:phosphatidylinositol alpha-1,6-mannosyltransferase
VPQIAGNSGGAAEAVAHGVTGLVTDDPASVDDLADALATLLADPEARRQMGEAGRERAVAEFSYDVLAARLHDGLQQWERTR